MERALHNGVLVVLLGVLAAPAQSYEPFAHYDRAMYVSMGISGSAVAAGSFMLTSEDEKLRRVGRQVALLGLAEAAAAGLALYQNEQARAEGMAPGQRTDEFRQELLTGMLFDFVYTAVGVVILQHGTREGSRARGIRYVSRGAFQFMFGAVNLGLTMR